MPVLYKYIIIEGTNAYLKRFENDEKALTYAQNFMDHSKEIIVRRVDTLTMCSLSLT